MGIQFSDRVENIVGKKEFARYEQFFFSTMFSKADDCLCVKMSTNGVKG